MMPNSTPRISHIPCLLERLQRVLLITALASLTLVMGAQVLLRYVFQSPFLGIEEVAVLFGLWSYFIGAAHVTAEDGHIRGGILSALTDSARVTALAQVLSHVVCLIINATFAYFAIVYFLTTWASGRDSSYLNLPTVIWIGSAVLGFALMTGYSLASLRASLTSLRRLGEP